jgi:hypothetical protein
MQRQRAATPKNQERSGDEADLTQQYRAIGSAAILAALACRMKKAGVEEDAGAVEVGKTGRKAA